jgi:hypothetical protein
MPYHEDVRSKVRMEGPEWIGGYHDVEFDVNRMAVTSPGYETLGEIAPISPLRASPGKGGSDIGQVSEMGVYHASPHIFEKFDLSKVGTGEGAQAFGHGVYLSESKTVQDFYHKQFQTVLDTEKAQLTNRIEAFKQRMKEPRLDQETWKALQQQVEDLTNQLQRRDWNAQRYDVEIPDEAVANMMDWDAPLSKQPKVVQDMAKRIRNVYGPSRSGMSGGEFYKNLRVHLGGEKQASEWLKKNGVPGMRYFDGDSRQATYGTRNFVVFDDAVPQIKYRGKEKINLGAL